MPLSDISVKVSEKPSGLAYAVMNELADLLGTYIETGEPASIDLRSLPMSEAAHEELGKLLGEGEVDIQLNTIGKSRIRETAFSGVWWVSHFGDDGGLLSEFLEVTDLPQIVKSDAEDITDARQRLIEVSNQSKMGE